VATRVEELERWVRDTFGDYKSRLDRKYGAGAIAFTKKDYELLEDKLSVITDFSVDPKTGEVTDIEILLKEVKIKELHPEDINNIANLIRRLGFKDVPITITPNSLSIKAEKEKKEFTLDYYSENPYSFISGEPSLPYVRFRFPIEMKTEIPKIVETLHKYFSQSV